MQSSVGCSQANAGGRKGKLHQSSVSPGLGKRCPTPSSPGLIVQLAGEAALDASAHYAPLMGESYPE